MEGSYRLIDAKDHEIIPCIHESVRYQGRAPCRPRATSGHRSFPDCALHCERRLRSAGALAQTTGVRIGRLLQPGRRSPDSTTNDRDWPRSVAMAARGRDLKRQPATASHLRAHYRDAYLFSLVDALAPPRER